MALLDVFLLVACALFAVSGYRQGFVVGVLSFVGFLGGGALGAQLAPALAEVQPLHDVPDAVLGLVVVLLAASTGQVVATALGAQLRDRLVWRPAAQVDAVAGAGTSVVGLLLVAWLIGTAVASSPYQAASRAVRESQVLAVVDGVVPQGVRSSFAGFRRLIDERGFPEVFGGLAPTQVEPVPPPDPALARSRAVTVARDRVLKITGVARSCSRRIEGTGFVYAPERVMTNAHVVAGVREPEVHVGDRRLDATVVAYDPGRDVAVLRVPGLRLAPLSFAGPADDGAGAVVVGYPNDGPFRADPARVRGTQKARGPDIYRQRTVVREVYALRARVQPGNSGGPLLAPDGRVYGVIFAAAADRDDTGYALTAREVAGVAREARTATREVSTQRCD